MQHTVSQLLGAPRRRLKQFTDDAKGRLLPQQGMQLWKRLPGAGQSRSVCGSPLQR